MDKSWMTLVDRTRPEYQYGVQQFLNFAYSLVEPGERIRCPCRKCNNVYFQKRDDVEADLFQYGIIQNYVNWVLHGEELDESDNEEFDFDEDDEDQLQTDGVNTSDPRGDQNEYANMHGMLEDCYAASTTNAWRDEESVRNENAVPEWESNKFMRLLKDADKELYPGCNKFTKLSFIVTLVHLKVLSGWSNKSFSMLLEILKKAFPDGDTLPSSYYEAKKIIKDLGLDYKKLHACVNDCILFRKEYENAEECPKCSSSRYKLLEVGNDMNGEKKRKKIPQKVLRYFPLKPRLRRLFISKKTAEDMRWHKEKRKDDGVLRHPADAQEWKEFDKMHELFSQDPRNVRLGLATDGFNPFSNMNLSHSTWPVILLPYNLPPWKCLKAPFFILSMLIPGPTSPGNDIDVFLELLIDELKDLWDQGVETYDASTGTNFSLRAAILWTIHDFPGYGIISGWSTKGYLACPVCNKETCSFWLKNSKKMCYMGHRHFLSLHHKWRNLKSAFDGKKEHGVKPIPLTGDEVVEQLECVHKFAFGKAQSKKRKRSEELNWKKYSIFFKLPYWKTLSLRHNLDVMHIEKNVCDNILGTLLDIDGKTKDTIRARFDLQELGIRSQLHPKLVGNSYVVPPACYTLSTTEKRELCGFLASIKYPDGFAASLSKRVDTKSCRITGMKTHDCHIILQQLLPISVRGLLNDNVCEVLHEFSDFFKKICSNALNKLELEHLEDRLALTLCKLEKIFSPSFFDVMVHLPVHLAREAILGGPVQYRWMYPIERYLYKLKQYVGNKAFPEGSMAEGYIAEECLTFCSMYLNDIETQFNKAERNYERLVDRSQRTLSVFCENSRLIGKGVYAYLDEKSCKQAHAYVLKNCDEVLTFISEHKEELKQNGCADVEKKHEESFPSWFEQRIVLASSERTPTVNDDLLHLAYGPDKRCDWYEGRSVQKDKYGYVSINISKPWKTNEPYVLASQAQQVFYVNDIKLGNDWKVVIEAQGRSSWNVLENKEDECITIDKSYQHNELGTGVNMQDFPSDAQEWLRNDIPPTIIDSSGVTPTEEQIDSVTDVQDEDDEEDYTLAEYDDDDEEDEGNDDDYEMD